MIDTIKIQISSSVFEIKDYSQFNTTEDNFNRTVMPFYIWKHKSTYKKSKKEYLPMIKILQTGSNYKLTIKFSAPKIMFGE